MIASLALSIVAMSFLNGRRCAILRSDAIHITNPGSAAHICTSGVCAQTGDMTRGSNILTSTRADGSVAVAGTVQKRLKTAGRIGCAGSVDLERTLTVGHITAATSVA